MHHCRNKLKLLIANNKLVLEVYFNLIKLHYNVATAVVCLGGELAELAAL